LFVVLEKMDQKRKRGEVAPGSHQKGIEVRRILEDVTGGSLTSQSLAARLQIGVDHMEVHCLEIVPLPLYK